MFDLDVAGMFGRLSKIKDATLLLSNPCIEYWFLLHYGDVSREMTSAECLVRLKGKVPDYAKGFFSTAMKKVLIENIGDAAARAADKEPYTNPSSTIHLLANELRVNF